MASLAALGRYTEPAIWVLVALKDGPRTGTGLLDEVRSLDGPVGHGTLYAAVARLERLALVESLRNGVGRAAYRLTGLGVAAAGAAAALEGAGAMGAEGQP